MNSLEIKKFREIHSLSQDQLAKIVGVKVGTVSKWEQGARNIGQSAILLLKDYDSREQVSINNIAQKKSPNDRFEDIVAKKVMDLMEIKLKIITMKFHQMVEVELAKQALRIEQMQESIEVMEENIIKETTEIKNKF